MRTTLIAIMTIMLALPLSAQPPVDFWRIREGSAVTVVLGTGGECKGKVAKRVDGALTIQLSEESSACGARDALVTVSEANTRTVERAPKSSGKRAAKSAAAVGVAAGAGLLLASRFGYLNQYAWVVCIGLGLLAVLAASHVPALAGPGLLLAIDGPLLAGNRLGNRPRSPGITGAVPSQTVGSDSAGGG